LCAEQFTTATTHHKSSTRYLDVKYYSLAQHEIELNYFYTSNLPSLKALKLYYMKETKRFRGIDWSDWSEDTTTGVCIYDKLFEIEWQYADR
jgi:hypothetical protein